MIFNDEQLLQNFQQKKQKAAANAGGLKRGNTFGGAPKANLQDIFGGEKKTIAKRSIKEASGPKNVTA